MFANPSEPDEEVLANLGGAAIAPTPNAPEENGENDATEDQDSEEEEEEENEEDAAADGVLLEGKKGSLQVSCMEVSRMKTAPQNTRFHN